MAPMKMAVVAAVAAGAVFQMVQASAIRLDAVRTVQGCFDYQSSSLVASVVPSVEELSIPDGGSTVLMIGLALVIAAIVFRRRFAPEVTRKPGPPVSEPVDR